MSRTPADLIASVRELIAAIPTTAPGEIAARAEALRAQIGEAPIEGGDAEAMGLLNDAAVSLILYTRAVQSGDADRAEGCLEMGRLFLVAAASPPAPLRPGEGGTPEGRDNAKGTAPSRGRG